LSSTVTIGICVRNGELSIGDAIESINTQSYPRSLMELIVADDGSSDGTLQVVKNRISKSDISCRIFSFDEKGLGYARNMVVQNAKGKYLIWVDSDNILTKDFVKKQVEFMEKNPNVGMASGMIWFPEQANIVLKLELAPLIAKYHGHVFWNNQEVTKLPGTAGMICRTDLLRQIGGFDKTITGAGEDQDVATRILNLGWYIRRTDVLFYETHGGMTTLKQLWDKYVWYGLSAFPLYHRSLYKISILFMNPLAGLLSGLKVAKAAYPILYKKSVFLSPLHYQFKMFAYLKGFNTAKKQTCTRA
jgi:glycosyltransferase involved in cell wall biosynthesis